MSKLGCPKCGSERVCTVEVSYNLSDCELFGHDPADIEWVGGCDYGDNESVVMARIGEWCDPASAPGSDRPEDVAIYCRSCNVTFALGLAAPIKED